MTELRIKAPLLHAGEVQPLVAAGASVLYAGIQLDAGPAHPLAVLDRRGCAPHNVSEDGFRQLARAVHDHGAGLLLTLNAQQLPAQSLPRVYDLIEDLSGQEGFEGVIVSSPELLREVAARWPQLDRIGSIVLNVFNVATAKLYRDLGASTLVLDRQLRIEEVATLTQAVPDVHWEAILFHDYCGNIDGACHMMHDSQLGDDLETGCMGSFQRFHGRSARAGQEQSMQKRFEHSYPVRDSACGACVVRRFVQAGVDSLKVAGRIHSLEAKLRGVHMARAAIEALGANDNEQTFRQQLQEQAPQIRGRECFDPTCLIRHYERRPAAQAG